MSRLSLLAVPVAAAFLSLAGACGGNIAATPGGSDAGPGADTGTPITPPSSTVPPTPGNPPTPDGLVLPADGTLTLTLDGGFSANGTDTSACTVEHESYVYTRATGQMVWERCVIADGGSRNDLLTGQVQLTDGQTKALDAALEGVRVVGIVSTCGSDLPEETATISEPGGLTPETYYDQFTRCGDRTLTHVTGLENVHSVLGDAAH